LFIRNISWLLWAAVSLLEASGFSSGVPARPLITTDHFDVTRQSWNPQEYILTPANVASHFGKVGTYSVDGLVYAQPLYIPAVVTSGVQRDLLIVVTQNNTVYAFDANAPTTAAVWSSNLGTPTTTNCTDLYDSGQEVGIMSTPVVDRANNHLFAVASISGPSWQLFELNLQTGATISSAVISGSVSGTGSGSSGGTLAFAASDQDQRVGLTLANGNVYIGFGGYCDVSPWHGWIFAYSAASLSQVALFCTTPNGDGGGIWNSTGGLVVDGMGNLYTYTGNGDWDGTANFGESILKFNSSLTLTDWFTPANWATLNSGDLDLSAGRGMLWNGLIVGSGKDARVITANASNLGHLQGVGSGPVQIFSFGSAWLYGGMFFNGAIYFSDWSASDGNNGSGPVYSFAWNGTAFATSGTVGLANYGFPGAQLSASSDGAANGILWITTTSSTASHPVSIPSGTLRALNPLTLAEIYNSDTAGGDSLGLLSKMSSPTVAHGRVYVATQSSQIAVYGLK